jgi:hypothetical protein
MLIEPIALEAGQDPYLNLKKLQSFQRWFRAEFIYSGV